MLKIYLNLPVLFLFLIQPFVSAQNIRINEIMSSNSTTVSDEDGDFSDWIELYNAGTTAVQLEGWGLSDNYNNPFKWTFPEYILEPDHYLLIWASGKNRVPVKDEMVNGLMREVYLNISGSSISDLLQHPDYPDNPALQQILKENFQAPINYADNYGQRIHGLVKAPATGDFTFWISSDDHGQLFISPDSNPANLQKIAEVPGWSHLREWDRHPQQKSQPFYMEEGKFYYIMALMKEGIGEDHLTVRWQWPNGTIEEPLSAEHLFFVGTIPLHTNFSIDAEGEPIILTDKSGNKIDELLPVKLPTDISYGRSPDGGSDFMYYSVPTPGKQNSKTGFSELLEPPVFSHLGGFYLEAFQLALSSPQPGVSIIYSIDGSEPSTGNLNPKTYYYKNQYAHEPGSTAGPLLTRSYRSYSYSSPLPIFDRSSEQNQISLISTTFHSSPLYSPTTPVEKAIVVKARVEKQGALASETVTHTYFVTKNGQNLHTLPVISIATQENHLFDYSDGIYTAGEEFENWRTANPDAEANGRSNANYHRNNIHWEYPASFELFEEDGNNVLNQQIGLRLHGNWSRAWALKSMRIHARNIYGKSRLDYSFFKDQEYDSYKRLLLRNSGNDYWSSYFRDAAMQEMIRHMDFETQAYQPSVVYLNGEYWGIHNIRERFDKHYIARKFGVDEERIDMLDKNSTIETGDKAHYIETLDYIRQNGLQSKEHYEYIKTRISVESFIDYMVAETYVANTDWPGNNFKYWRHRIPQYDPTAGPGKDGRWRWMIYDTDQGFGLFNKDNYARNMIEHATDTLRPEWSTFLFRSLLENQNFRTDFITRYSDQLNSAFIPEVVKPVIEKMKNGIEPEIERHYERWKAPSDLSTWNRRIDVMYHFADNRPAYVWEHLRDFFDLEERYHLTANVSDQAHGHIIVNTLPITKDTRGVSENPWPWQGEYFKNLPLRLEAIPEKGFEFVRWENGNSTYHEPVLEIHPESNEVFTAVFEKSAITNDQLIHYWNFNETGSLLIPTYTLISAEIQPSVPTGGTSEITYASGQGFTGENARFGDEPGNHLRFNNPLGASLTFGLPTTGFSQIKLSYETRRSGQGAGTQIIEYSVNGVNFIPFTELTIEDADPALMHLDLSAVVSANNNPQFKIRISFAQGGGGTAGNNRFDNITLEGIPGDDVNLPPVIENLPEDVVLTEGEDFSMNLNELFYDPEGDPLEFSVSSRYTHITEAVVENGLAIFNVKQRGESLIQVTASDGINPPVEVRFRMMVFPKAFPLAESNFSFSNWNENSPEMTFPEHMLFLQSNIDDPSIIDPLDFAYYIPVDEYADDDAANVGFPYRNTRRTRLNGLGENGISFINTGRGRDLGGALMAINTTGLDEIQTQWLVGTILQNSREYGLILQYRIGTEGDFTTLPSTGYVTEIDGSTITRGPFSLPPELMNQEYVQLLWRYHYLSGTIGPRAQLRLDDILIAAKPDVPEIIAPISNVPLIEDFTIEWTATGRAQEYEFQLADNEDFLNPMVSVGNISETSYRQNALNEEQYYFVRVRAINEMTTGDWSEVVTLYDPATSAGMYELDNDRLRVFPNPFNESVHLHFILKQPGKANIGLFDLSGRKVMNIYQGFLPAGENTHIIEGGNLPAGTYILIYSTGSGIHRQKLIKR